MGGIGLKKIETSQAKELERKLGVVLKDHDLLKRALTHKSYANEYKLGAQAHNERLEFLGDAVLEVCVSHLLMERFPNDPEGELSKLRAAVVNETELARLARELDLGHYLYIGRGEEQTGGREKPSLLSNTFEAILGAIYLDRGFARAFQFVRKHYRTSIEEVSETGFAQDYKTRLQEAVQAVFKTIPQYKLIRSFGPDHAKIFEVQLLINEEAYGSGTGSSKKQAEQEAAREALAKLQHV